MLSKDEVIENFTLATVACDKTIQSLRSQQIKEGDARLSFYYKIRTLYNMFRLNYEFYDKYLLTRKFFDENNPDHIMSDKNMTKLCDEYDIFTRSTFITEFYSAFESSFRVIIQAIDSDYYDKNKRYFTVMAKKILNDFKLQEESELIRHFSLIRNSVHSNGLFDPIDGKNQTIHYRGKDFLYEVGKPIQYAGWTDLLSILKLIHFLFYTVISNSKVQNISFIKEPASDFWSKLD